ncbi:MAG: helix-turn-helix domain-containing protein [Pseudomonadota bacterium]
MIDKKPLNPARIRKISGSFAFIEHRFRYFIKTLTHQELLLYLFLVLAADKQGLSYYSTDTICACLKISLRQYLKARQSLIRKDLIAFDGRFFQVLSLPFFTPLGGLHG